MWYRVVNAAPEDISDKPAIDNIVGYAVKEIWTAVHSLLRQWKWIHWRVAEQQEAWWDTFSTQLNVYL